MKRFILPLVSLVSVAIPCHAADEDAAQNDIRDLRLQIALVPGTKDIHSHVSEPVNNFSAEDTLSGLGLGVRFELGYYGSFQDLNPNGSLFCGIALFDTSQSGDSNGDRGRGSPLSGPIKLSATGADLFVGYAVPIVKNTHAEIGPYIGFGTAAIDDSGTILGNTSNTTKSTGHGHYREYGVRLSLLYTSPDNSLQAGIGASYFGSHSTANLTFNIANGIKYETITIDQSGIEPFITVGANF